MFSDWLAPACDEQTQLRLGHSYLAHYSEFPFYVDLELATGCLERIVVNMNQQAQH